MEIKILDKNGNEMRAELSGINEAEANTLRRFMVAETPTLAIDEVEFFSNDSPLYDEILAHRLGLVPIVTDSGIYNIKNYSCQVSFDGKGPKTVYSSDLVFSDKNVKVAFDEIPIVSLLDDQTVKFVATASVGFGKEHIKFAPGAVFYKHKPILKINKNAKNLDKFPKTVIKDGKLDEQSLLKDDLYESCETIDYDALKIDYENDKFIFTIESFGQLSPEDILQTSIEMFNTKLDAFSKGLKSAKPTIIKTLAKKVKK
jgi:DNA-directed RNA polymerase subunit D